MDDTKRLFISHSEKDKPLAAAIVDLLQTGVDVSQANIFCTSLEGLDIPSGVNFIDHIASSISDAECIIILLTPNFFNSQFCLCELGATWMEKKRIHPMIVPPLDYDDVKTVLTGINLLKMDSVGDLDRLFDELKVELSITTAATARWSVQRDLFLTQLESIVEKLPQPQTVRKKDYDSLESSYQESVANLSCFQTRYKELELQIEEIKNLKDAEEVREYELKHSTELDKFEHLVGESKSQLSKVPNIARYLVLRYRSGLEGHLHPTNDMEKHDAAMRAVEQGFLTVDDENCFSLQRKDPSVERILHSIEELDYFIKQEMSGEFADQLKERDNFVADLKHARFWSEYLGLDESFYD